MEGEIITREKHPEIYKWLSKNVEYYKDRQKYFTLSSEGKINADCGVYLREHTTEIKYPFGYIKGSFRCAFCENLTSLVNSPEEVGGDLNLVDCINLTSFIGLPKYVAGGVFLTHNKFSNVPIYKERYEIYIDMLYNLLESVGKDYVKFYLINYEYKTDGIPTSPIIPKDVINRYKILFLLNEK